MLKFTYSKLFVLCLLCSTVSADTLVLIHGYLSNSHIWHESKVIQPLKKSGWSYGGNYISTPHGIFTPQTQAIKATLKTYYTVDLPADAPIEYQATVLGYYLQHLYTQRQEPLILVGHSAGGVVARAWLTMPVVKPTKALITIASPHLGTPFAQLASWGSKTPINEAGRVMGLKNFRQSKAVFSDLKEEKSESGNYLYWLNHQPHPAIHYVSVMRKNKVSLKKFDYIVPKKSQNMNNIWALKGQSAILLTTGDHFLTGRDGVYINRLIEQMSIH